MRATRISVLSACLAAFAATRCGSEATSGGAADSQGVVVADAAEQDGHGVSKDSVDGAGTLEVTGPPDAAGPGIDLPTIVMPDAAQDTSLPDAEPEATGPGDVAETVDSPPDTQPETVQPPVDPSQWGPHQVGTTSFQFFDWDRMRMVPTTVWYPASPSGQDKAKYLMLIQGNAYSNAPQDPSGAPYPIVMFSHGFKGTAVQSVTFTEYLASHGYVVAAMDHQGNTLTDFFADDETVANVAIERPRDVRFAFEQVVAQSASPSGVLTGMVDPSRVAVTGHSFGGYTALMVSGGEVDVSAAQAACAAGAPSDIFCPYVGYWPAGEIVKLDPGIPGLKAEVCLTPGGYSAYGDDGLTKVKVPSMIFGGTLDETTPVSVEIDPIFNALPPTKAEVIIENASHMSYTNVCDLPLAQQWLADFCNVDGMLGPEETFAIANPLAVAFLNWQVKGDASYESYVSQTYADMKLGPAQVKVEK